MKKKLALLAMFATVAAPVATMLATLNPVQAASITNLTVALGTQNQSTATSVVIAYTAPTAIANGSVIEVTYDTSFTGGAALTSADVVLTGSGASGITTSLSGQVAGYFKLTVTAMTGSTTSPVLTLNGTNKLTTAAAAGNYSFSATDTVGATVDTGAGLAYVSSNATAKENQVLITATVPPVIALDLYNTGTAVKMTDPNTCPLGVLSINKVNTCTYDVGAGTNDTAGMTVKTQANNGLTNGTYTLANASGAITAGTEAYGFAITTNGSVFTPSGSFGTQYQAVPLSLTTFATSAAVSNEATIAQHFTVTHAATMSSSTNTGSFTSLQSYQGFTN